MSDIAPIDTSSGLRVRRVSVDPSAATSSKAEEVRGRGGARTSDRVELSRVAQLLSQANAGPAPRTDLTNRVKSEIAAGTYLTDEKLEAVVDDLLEDINFEL